MKGNFNEAAKQELHSEKLVTPVLQAIYQKLGRGGLILLVLAVFFPALAHAQLIVDCSGNTPGAYTTINAALANVTGPGAVILVSGICTENVVITNMFNLSLGAWWGQTATVHGNIAINTSEEVYIYGLNVSNSAGDGFTLTSARGVTLDTCTSNGNQAHGLTASSMSQITVLGPASFDNNGPAGVYLTESSSVTAFNSNGPMDISNNKGPGLYLSQANFETIGATTLLNNLTSLPANPEFPNPGFGVTEFGGSRAQFGTCLGSNLIEGNQAGGVSVQESSEISLWNCGSNQNVVEGNGPVGISAGLASQVTLYDNVLITGHTGPGVDLFAASQLNAFGKNQISQNGSASDSRSAAIRIDGNSEAFLRGGQISQNAGPAILALVNSSADFTGVTFAGNSGGIITCDTSAYMVSDLTSALSGYSTGIQCRTPNSLGNHHFVPTFPTSADGSAQKARQAQYKKIASLSSH
ncbi:MAG: right-handed parallel beta-helix repeat-containing protein [Candidatus Acidiferrum sp.]